MEERRQLSICVAMRLRSLRRTYHKVWRSLKLFLRSSAALQARPVGGCHIEAATLRKSVVTHQRRLATRNGLLKNREPLPHLSLFSGRRRRGRGLGSQGC